MLSFLLSVIILCSLAAPAFSDGYNKIEKIDVSVFVGGEWHAVKAMNATYDNNLYFSMRSLAEAFSGTSKEFNFLYDYTKEDGSFFKIEPGKSYAPVESDDPEDPGFIELNRNRLFVNGEEKRYYSYRFGDPEDLYFSAIDICMILDIGASLVDKNAVFFNVDTRFSPSITELDADGYFNSLNCVLFSNIKSGDVYFAKDAGRSFPVASITKLMTYLVIMDKMSEDRIPMDTPVPVSSNAEKMSLSENGLIKMEQGQMSSAGELINAMLVASSNEAAIALVEYFYRSENAITTQMNRRARELGLEHTRFYNCTGLPVFSESVFPVKKQNYMSGTDIMKLLSVIFEKYPQITDITSQQYAYFPTFEYNTANSNPLVFNCPYVNGLKTGSTNLAGSCLVASDTDGNIVVVLGAEDNSLRGRVAELLFRSVR